MSAATLQVAVADEVACIKVSGPANFAVGVDFKKVAAECCEKGGRILLLDTDCVNLDSTFLGILMGMTSRLERIELLNPSERITDNLDNLGVLDLLQVGQGANPFEAHLDAAPSTKATKKQLAQASLEAHRLLMEINPENVPKFQDVTKYLEQDLKRRS